MWFIWPGSISRVQLVVQNFAIMILISSFNFPSAIVIVFHNAEWLYFQFSACLEWREWLWMFNSRVSFDWMVCWELWSYVRYVWLNVRCLTLVVFHLRNIWRFSTYQNFWFFLDPFFSKFSKNLVFKRFNIGRVRAFLFWTLSSPILNRLKMISR